MSLRSTCTQETTEKESFISSFQTNCLTNVAMHGSRQPFLHPRTVVPFKLPISQGALLSRLSFSRAVVAQKESTIFFEKTNLKRKVSDWSYLIFLRSSLERNSISQARDMEHEAQHKCSAWERGKAITLSHTLAWTFHLAPSPFSLEYLSITTHTSHSRACASRTLSTEGEGLNEDERKEKKK